MGAIERWGIAALFPENGFGTRRYGSGIVGYKNAHFVVEGQPRTDSRAVPGDEPLPTDFRGNLLIVPRNKILDARFALDDRIAVNVDAEIVATKHYLRKVPTARPSIQTPLAWNENVPVTQAMTEALSHRTIDGVDYDFLLAEYPDPRKQTIVFEIGNVAARSLFRLEVPDGA